ncbi:4233_t:CDS:2 [Diversispora eburnea]|uniref:4233_t:CDS:1 n=1 Tax=Diversispora eburnea TaxID=1213867 RepID=A0A9N9FP72_9GLOM|nr:4233_t:CDS:2 [Diversispora eburnea]
MDIDPDSHSHLKSEKSLESISKLSKLDSLGTQFGFVVGINEVTKHLEQPFNSDIVSYFQKRYHRNNHNLNRSLNLKESNKQQREPLRMVFVCKADLSTPNLVSHFPIMTSIAHVLLVLLPLNSSKVLEEYTGINKIRTLGIKKRSPAFDNIYKLVQDRVKPVAASWLMLPLEQEISKKRRSEEEQIVDDPSSSTIQNQIPEMLTKQVTSVEYFPTKIKQLKTTAPVNKEQHTQEKRLKKKQRKLLKQETNSKLNT